MSRTTVTPSGAVPHRPGGAQSAAELVLQWNEYNIKEKDVSITRGGCAHVTETLAVSAQVKYL
jgi:hypothetical protein